MTGVLETFESDPTFDAARNEPILQEARIRLVEAKTAALETAAQEDDAGVHVAYEACRSAAEPRGRGARPSSGGRSSRAFSKRPGST